MKNIVARLFLLLIAVAADTSSHSQQPISPAQSTRPKLGLVLEGGGALGLAHIGVITWMEEHHIPVNYVAGTSMGGLVAGMYATGRSPGEIKEIIDGIEWDQVLAGYIPMQDLSFRRKQDEHDVPASLEFGLRKGLQFPAGFNSGQQVDLILARVALPYSQVKSFDELPIPFACVATDLISGKPHVFHDGSLALAMRSTMSLPGIFSPVRSGDRLYVDGGLLNNIPIDVAKALGAQITLGIHLETASLSPKESLPSYGVLGESISVMIASNELRSMEQADLLVSVPLQKYTALDYDKAEEIIKAGYDAAAGKGAVLASLSVSDTEWAEYLAARNARKRTTPVPTFIAVSGASPDADKAIQKDMSALVGKPVDTKEIDQQMMNVSGLGRFATATYSMTEQNGQQGLLIETTEKSYAPPTVRPLILIDGSDYNNVLFSMGARITFLDLGGYRSDLRNDLIVGSQYLFSSEYYHPFTPTSRWFIAPRLLANSAQYNIYSDKTLLAEYRLRQALGGLDTGYSFGKVAEFRLGVEGGWQGLSPEAASIPNLPSGTGPTSNLRIQFQVNTLDNAVIPRSGFYLNAYTKGYFENPAAPEAFPLSEVSLENFIRISKPSSIYIGLSGGSSYGYQAGLPPFSLGGSQRLYAWNTNQLLTDQYFLAQLGYIQELVKLPPLLGSSVNLLSELELGKTYQLPLGPKPPNLPMDAAVAVLVDTIFGPVIVGGAVGEYGHHRFFFRIGRTF